MVTAHLTANQDLIGSTTPGGFLSKDEILYFSHNLPIQEESPAYPQYYYPQQPQLEEFRMREEQSERISFLEDKAFIPLGAYGLWVKDLQ